MKNKITDFYKKYPIGTKVKLNEIGSFYHGKENLNRVFEIVEHMPDDQEKFSCMKAGTKNPNSCNCWQMFKLKNKDKILDWVLLDEFTLVKE